MKHVFEFAHLERGAHQNRDLVERMVLAAFAACASSILLATGRAISCVRSLPAASE